MRGRTVLLASVFVVAVCGLVYELLAGTLSSYLLGDSVTHFSLVIGVFLSSMGLGAWLAKYVRRELLRRFLAVEIAVGVAGGFSAAALQAAFTYLPAYLPALFAVGGLVGALIGMEIPLLIRILEEDGELRLSVSDVLAADYVGALAGSVLFPLLLVPHLGLMRTAFLFGLLNVGVAALGLWWFREELGRARALRASCAAAALLLAAGFAGSHSLVRFFEEDRYEDEIIFAKQTAYQRIVLTRWRDDLRLHLNGSLQFSTVDEHRYHEALVHPALSLAGAPGRVLVLGGGDGMAVREVLKHPSVAELVLVDLDPEMTRLFRDHPALSALSGRALADPRVRIVNRDAMAHLREDRTAYDVVLMDLPDPDDLSLGKLYSVDFFRLALARLAPKGLLVTQATSPFYARDAFWCIARTLREAGARVAPYHALVPSFGDWGFVLASREEPEPQRLRIEVPTRFLTDDTARAMFRLPKDLEETAGPVNRLDDQALVRLYDKGWKRWNY